jgi:galactokinase
VGELFVPGRLCLFGEHSDWAGGWRRVRPDLSPGFCLVAGTDQGIRGEAEAAGAFEITSVLASGEEIGPARIEARPAALAEAARGADFFSYAAGVAAEMAERHGTGGLRVRVAGDLPVRKGLSSSAAICVLVARAFASVYGLALTVREEMELAYAGERRTGSECGRMDQVCAYGRRVTFLRFDGDAFEVEPLAAAAPLQLLIVDLRRGKDTRRILADLNACFPDAPGALAAGVREALGPRNAALLARAKAALEAGDERALGALMSEAQALFDEKVAPASPAELAAPRLHAVLAHPALRELAWGGKGVGSQGDGCAQLVARGPAERARLAAVLERDLGVRCWPLTVGTFLKL